MFHLINEDKINEEDMLLLLSDESEGWSNTNWSNALLEPNNCLIKFK